MELITLLSAGILFVYYLCVFLLVKWLIISKRRDSKKVFIFKLLSVLLAFIGGWVIVFLG
jgi:hypothetical protein|nr:MAG TPA: hypothetical protein [Crassvirales sp.]